KRSIPVT
ncbi:hypothetical protein ACS0PU_010876, partial [Formica fusca]